MVPASRLRRWIAGAILAAATAVAYLPLWRGAPLWDDDAHLTRPELQSWTGLWRIWSDPGATRHYAPLTHSFFWLQHWIWGNNPLGYHLVNIALHALSALLLARLLVRLRVPGAHLAAGLFALHPAHVASVAGIAQLNLVLSVALYLGAALFYRHFDLHRRPPDYRTALALFALALLAHSVTATLPVALLILLWWRRGRLLWRRDVRPLAPFLAVGIVAGAIALKVESGRPAPGSDAALSIVEQGLAGGRALCFYAAKLVWPANLTAVHPEWEIDAADAQQYVLPLVLALLLGVAWLARRKARAPLAAFLFYGLTLLPALGLLSLDPARRAFAANQCQYLASLGIIVPACAWGVRLLYRLRPGPRSVARLAGLTLPAALSVLTWQQCKLYAKPENLYRATIERHPTCWAAYNSLGDQRRSQGRNEEALHLYRLAEEYQHSEAAVFLNLGLTLQSLGRMDQALDPYRQALLINPRSAPAHFNYGNLLVQLGERQEAKAHFETALAIDPQLAEAHYSLALALLEEGQMAESARHLRRTVALYPTHAAARNNLGLLLIGEGRPAEALAHLQKALRASASFPEAHNNAGLALVQLGRWEEAVEHYRQALARDPSYVQARVNLGRALLHLGRAEEALAEFQKAEVRKPDAEDAGK